MLANVGPLPDGSIHPEDIKSLRECGERIRNDGWPTPDEATGTTEGGSSKNEPAAG
jgi:hypothetical protein